MLFAVLLIIIGPGHGESGAEQIKVTDRTGNIQVLDPSKRPVLFFAWWCSHCDEVLSVAANMPEEKRPVLVSTYLKDDFERETIHKLTKNGLPPVFYYDDANYPEIVPLLVTKTSWINNPKLIINELMKG